MDIHIPDEDFLQYADIWPIESFTPEAFDNIGQIIYDQALSCSNPSWCCQRARFGSDNALNKAISSPPTHHHSAYLDSGLDPRMLCSDTPVGGDCSLWAAVPSSNLLDWAPTSFMLSELDTTQLFPPYPDLRDDGNDSASRWHCSKSYDNRSTRPAAHERLFSHAISCNVKDCTYGPFPSTCEFQLHLQEHSNIASALWKEGLVCTWPHCTSKAIFKTRATFQTHLDNIHVNPVLCPAKDCTYKKPFRNRSELQRHIDTAHPTGELPYKCPYLKCRAHPREFARKDKWLVHIRKGHIDTSCPLNHCEDAMRCAFATQEELVEHIKKCHGNYECGLGSCSLKGQSRFSEFDFLKHLEFHHGIQGKDLGTARNAVNAARDRTVRPTHLPGSGAWIDCRHCRMQSPGKQGSHYL